jgi:hypothetical protein
MTLHPLRPSRCGSFECHPAGQLINPGQVSNGTQTIGGATLAVGPALRRC